jgi:hypothetical protein
VLIVACGIWPQAITGWSEQATSALALRGFALPARMASTPEGTTTVAIAHPMLPS